MRLPRARGPFVLSLRRCLRAAAAPSAAAVLLAWSLQALSRPQLGALAGDGAAAAGSPWLVLPLFVAAIACAVAAVRFWPVFAARADGADWVHRLQRGPWRGCGAAIAAALLAQVVLSLPITTLLARAIGAPGLAHAHVALAGPDVPLLDERGPRMRFDVPPGLTFDEVQLRPIASLPAGPLRTSRLRVLADGESMTDAEVAFEQSQQLVRVRCAARTCHHLDLVLAEGNVPLYFAGDSVVLIAAGGHSTIWNGVALAVIALVPTFVALSIACLCGVAAALATVLTVLASLLFVQTIGEAGPLAGAARGLLRGEWLGAGPHFPACFPFLAAGALAMILTMVSRRNPRR